MNIRAKVTAKGQITLPAELRRALGVKQGDHIDFRKNKKGNYELVVKTLNFKDLRGIIKLDGPPPTTDDIVEIVQRARQGRGKEILRRATRGRGN